MIRNRVPTERKSSLVELKAAERTKSILLGQMSSYKNFRATTSFTDLNQLEVGAHVK
jgi:hypothetical protein